MVLVLLLGATAFQTVRLSRDVADLRRATSANEAQLRDARAVIENDQAALDERVGSVEESQERTEAGALDAGAITAEIGDSVFTLKTAAGQGTGFAMFVIGGETHIVTNYHVVQGARTVSVSRDLSQWTGTVVAWDAAKDVAIVSVNGLLPVLTSAYDEGSPPVVGDPVLAYGSPLGLEGTATEGIVSAVRGGYIQTDAQINHGNSGGPLLNNEGQVIGITSLGFGDGSGVGFAIDIRTVCTLFKSGSCP